jgi:hypothetical protein
MVLYFGENFYPPRCLVRCVFWTRVLANTLILSV